MFVQREVFRSGMSMPFNQTKEIDLPKSGRLSSIVLYVRSTENGAALAATVVKWRLIDYISKIEVIGDGSTVIKSFDGRQALASAFWDDKREPASMWRAYSSDPHRQWIPIHLGRWFRDQLFDLDLSRFNQVTLKITNTATSTEFTTDIQLDVVLFWKREWPSGSQGYLREEEWKVWAPAAAEVEYNDLPTLLPIRRILLRARPAVDTADAKNNASMHRNMSDIDFTIRTGQVRVYKGSLETLGHLSTMEYDGRIETMGLIQRNTGYGYESGVGYVTNGIKATGSWDPAVAAYPLSLGVPDVQDSSQSVDRIASASPLEWLMRGHGYMHNVPLVQADAPDLSDMLNPDAEKVVKADILCASGTTTTGTDRNAENAIVLSRLVR